MDKEEKIKAMNNHLEQFKQMSFRAKARIERLAELSLVIEDDLKFNSFADRVSELFGISNQFEEQLEQLINDYEIARNRVALDEEPE
ncbi:MAG: hypothetical protein P1V20_03160 [Verrucomicrobiales bacterium]|nr:hypothetical protein [Verrucomicrobiales bacterium]